ncbi:MAG TPA: prolipoprotein diacylglyceryl transferase [Egibacteraceae bacterium]|nr:prolipoprotein diacylglyceryl transferase [Egibacteraceae bacterium]
MVATIPSPTDNALEIGPLTLHYYGLAIALGAVLAVWLMRRRYGAVGGDPDLADRTAVWAILAGLVGARLAYVSTNLDRFLDRPWAVLFIWEGGLAFFGGLTLGGLAGLLYLRRQGALTPAFLDAAAPCIPLAHAVGRWGNYFNQELYGTPTGLPWGLEIDREPLPVHPTFLYESLANLVLAGVLILLGRSGRLAKGSLIFAYLVGYGTIRFLLELVRTDTEFRLLGISRNGYVALVVAAVGVFGLTWWNQRQADSEAAEAPASAAEE